MEKAISFIQAFIQHEHEGLIALYCERDKEAFKARKATVSQYYAPGITTMIDRPFKAADDWFKDRAEAERLLRPRKLFQIKHYRHPKYGDLFRCYVSDTHPRSDSYFSCLYVADVEGKLKIISRYNVDYDTNGWINRGGATITNPGKLIAVRKFLVPSNPEHLKEYESE